MLTGVAHCWIGTKATCTSMSGVVLEADWRERYPTILPAQGDPLNTADVVEMTILAGDARPINQQPYQITLAIIKVVEEELKKMLREDIEPSCNA